MTILSYRSAEPLYIVSMRNNPRADAMFRSWIRDHKIEHASVSSHRLQLHDQRGFERFCLTWTHGWQCLSVWDTWSRRHIYLD
jgi:hypothetical protein